MTALALWVGIIALFISLYAATLARRSADAAVRSARSAEEAVALKRQEAREFWIDRLATALPDPKRVTRLLHSLPDSLRKDWRQLVTAAAGRNPRTPEAYSREMLEKHTVDWEEAARSDSRATEVRNT